MKLTALILTSAFLTQSSTVTWQDAYNREYQNRFVCQQILDVRTLSQERTFQSLQRCRSREDALIDDLANYKLPPEKPSSVWEDLKPVVYVVAILGAVGLGFLAGRGSK